MLLNRIGALLVAGFLAVAHVTAASAADPLSPATKRLFDAVWADDMTQVKASVVDGANLEAINDDGVRAVDLAVDKGHYDIAHYLLSVERLRSDQSTATRAPAQPDPRSQAVPTPVPAPVPATAPVVNVAPAPIAPAGAPVPTGPAPPSQPAPSAANTPPPQPEEMWTAPSDGKETTQPGLRILGTAPAQPVRPVPAPAPSDTQPVAPSAQPAPPASGPQSQIQGGGEPEQPGFLGRVTDFLGFSEDAAEAPGEPAAAKPSPAPAVESAAAPTAAAEPVAAPEPVPQPVPEPAPPAAEAAPSVTAAPEPAAIPSPPPAPPAPAPASVPAPQPSASLAPAESPAPAPTPAPTDGPNLLDRISNFLKPDASGEEQALASPAPAPVTEEIAAAPSVETAAAPPPTEPAEPTEPGVGLWGRIGNFFTPDEAGAPATAESPPPDTPVETAAAPQPSDPPPQASEPEPAATLVETAPAEESEGGGLFDSLTSWLRRDEPIPEAAPDGQALAEPVIEIRPGQPSVSPPQPPASPPVTTPVAESAAQPIAKPVVDPSRQAEPGELRTVRAPQMPAPAPRPAAQPVPRATSQAAPEMTPQPAADAARSPEVAAVPPAAEAEPPRRVRQAIGGPPVRDPATIDEPLIATAALKDVSFEFGAGIQLGMKAPDADDGGTCIDKARWNTIYCIEEMTWPKSVASSFRAESSVYRGEKAIIQYENGRSVQMHVLFPTKALWAVSQHFKKLYGPPTEMPEVWTSMIGEPKRPNRVLRWHSRNTETGAETVLEIREIDDLRWSAPPDTKHGVVRVLEKGRGSVFQLLSSTDLLLVGLRGGRQ